MQTQFLKRQGEVIILGVESIPKAAKAQKGPIVLSRGSTTVHSHRVTGGTAKLLSMTEGRQVRRYLAVSRKVRVVCERHDEIDLPAGKYEVVIQRQQRLGRTSQSAD